MMNLLEVLSEQNVEEGRKTIIEKFICSSDEKAEDLAQAETRRRLMVRYMYPTNSVGGAVADWSWLIDSYRSGVTAAEMIVRSISQTAIDLLIARAILLSDFKSLEGLALATKEAHFALLDDAPQPVREIVSKIIWFIPILEEELEWLPSKEAVKFFLLARDPLLSDSSATWAKAWKQLSSSNPLLSKSRMTESKRMEILSVAKKYPEEN